MLVIRVELHSAITGKISEVARMIIANDGTGTRTRGNYWGRSAKGVIQNDHMIPPAIMHDCRKMDEGKVENYARNSLHVWNLLARMLKSMGYK